MEITEKSLDIVMAQRVQQTRLAHESPPPVYPMTSPATCNTISPSFCNPGAPSCCPIGSSSVATIVDDFGGFYSGLTPHWWVTFVCKIEKRGRKAGTNTSCIWVETVTESRIEAKT